jgi:hypothetical protein
MPRLMAVAKLSFQAVGASAQADLAHGGGEGGRPAVTSATKPRSAVAILEPSRPLWS